MSGFVFSADGHVREPNTLFSEGLPASLRDRALHAERRDDYMVTVTGDKIVQRIRLKKENEGWGGRKRLGVTNLEGRLADMKDDGIDAEIVFPSLGLLTYTLEDPELELATAQVYNDWNSAYFGGHLNIFVRCGVLPVRRIEDAVAELKRLAGQGFTAAMIPSVVPKALSGYNHEHWDPLFDAAGAHGVVLVMHTGTGLEDVVVERGPGGAIINYTRQMCDGQNAIMALVAGGVLDRNPLAKVAVIESGASWLAALSERMDEVHAAHDMFVRPKLSMKPSELISRQVACSFQYDRACIMARSVTGTQAILWGSDYPHAEGTFPNSRKVLEHLFDGIDISEDDKADIVGRNAARLFRLPQTAN